MLKNKNKILMLLQGTFPPDIRLEKEIKSLSEAGYEVLVLCNQYDKNLNPEFEFCRIERVKALFEAVRLNRIINFPIFFNPRFLYYVIKVTLNFKPSFIHSHDLPMMPIAILLGKLLLRKPIVFDMHENYPEALKAFQKKGIINFIFKNYRAAKYLEEICIRFSNKIITVVKENSDRLINQGVKPSKIYLVSNTVDLQTFNNSYVDEKIIDKYRNTTILLYSGYVTPERGLDLVVKGMNFLKDKIPEIRLLIIGNGISVPPLRKLTTQLSLDNYIEFIEWPGHDNLGSYFQAANIFISPQPKCEFWDTTIPHKLFEYMSQSKPVIAADSEAIHRIINETNSGMTYKTGSPQDFAEKILQMLSSNIPFGENGFKAVVEKYNWANDAKTLVQMYKELEKQV
jgi:glycosyltransferase involved in cell wall biosynthesis